MVGTNTSLFTLITRIICTDDLFLGSEMIVPVLTPRLTLLQDSVWTSAGLTMIALLVTSVNLNNAKGSFQSIKLATVSRKPVLKTMIVRLGSVRFQSVKHVELVPLLLVMTLRGIDLAYLHTTTSVSTLSLWTRTLFQIRVIA